PGLPLLGYISKTTYNDSRNEVLFENPRTFKTRTRRDALERVAETVVDEGGLNLTTRSTYDAAGNVRTLLDPQNGDVDVTRTYDQLSRQIRTEYVTVPSDHGTPVFEMFQYDAAGNVVHARDRRGLEQRAAFDNLDRLLSTELKE